MKIGIMQPYLFPYIGYFQLLNLVDEFIIHDDIQWIKGGWINRNRILTNNQDKMITLSVTKRSSYDKISQFEFSQDQNNHKKFLNHIYSSYFKSPYFSSVFPLIERIVLNKETNLTQYIRYSIEQISSYLNIKTPLSLSSNLAKNNDLKAQDRVIEICKVMKADTYINPIGGIELYNKEIFHSHGIKLYFIKTNKIVYKQYDNNFVPNLSIIDVIMFNSKNTIKEMLNIYDLL